MAEGLSTQGRATAAWIGGVLAAAGAFAYWSAARAVVGRAGLPLDDSWIHLHFARSLSRGWGLAFEQGELVAGSTAPLWTALLSLTAPLPGSPVVWSQLLGAAFFVLGAWAIHGLAAELGVGDGLAALATLLYATTGPLVWSAVSGLEIPLFVLLALTATRLHLRDRDTARGLALSLPLFALAALARPEGLLLLAAALLDRAVALRWRWSDWWRGWRLAGVVCGLILLPVVAFNTLASGSPLPTTFGAKTGALGGWTPSLRYLHTVSGILFRAQPYMTLLAAAGVVVLGQRLYTRQDRGLVPALWVVGLPLAYSCISPADSPLVGNFGRYYYPLLPFVICLGCLGLTPWAERLRQAREERRRWLVPVAAALLVLWPTLAHWRTSAGQFAQSVHDVESGDAAAARWLRGRLTAGETLAVNDIGVIKFLLPEHRIHDLAGIVSPEVHGYTAAALARGEPWEAGVMRYLERVRPDYLVVFPDWFPRLLASGVSFEPIQEFVVRGNITLGGDRLVIYRTPWRDPPPTP